MMEKQIEQLHSFEINADLEMFEECFGVLGKHLWDKFCKFDNSVLRLWSYLDLANRKALAKYIPAWCKKHYGV